MFYIMLRVIMLNVVMLNVVMMSVIMLSVIMMNVVMLNVVILNAIMLSVVAPCLPLKLMNPSSHLHIKTTRFNDIKFTIVIYNWCKIIC